MQRIGPTSSMCTQHVAYTYDVIRLHVTYRIAYNTASIQLIGGIFLTGVRHVTRCTYSFGLTEPTRARFRSWEAWGPAIGLWTYNFGRKVGEPSSRHLRRRRSRCRRRREGLGMGTRTPSQLTRGSGQWSNCIIIDEGEVKYGERYSEPIEKFLAPSLST